MYLHMYQLHSGQHPSTLDESKVRGVWVPSDRIVIHTIPCPTAPKRKWPELIPWLLEDKVLGSVEEIHFIDAGSNGKNAKVIDVLAVNKADMRHWIETAKSTDINTSVMVPDYLALPWQAGQISLAWQPAPSGGEGTLLLLRTGKHAGFAAEPTLAALLLDKTLGEQAADQENIEPGDVEVVAYMAKEEMPIALAGKVNHLASAPQWLHGGETSLNLLTGDFNLSDSNNTVSDLRFNWFSAALLVLSVLLCYTWLKLDVISLEDELVELQRSQTRTFSILYPSQSIIDDDVEFTLDSLEQTLFEQRERLQTPVAEALIGLDAQLSRCNCGVESLQLTDQGGELIVRSAQGMTQSFSRAGVFQIDRHQEADSDLTLLSLSRGPR